MRGRGDSEEVAVSGCFFRPRMDTVRLFRKSPHKIQSEATISPKILRFSVLQQGAMSKLRFDDL